MKIIEPETLKKYEVKNLRVVYYDIPNKEGISEHIKCVEFTVQGRNHNWDYWALYDPFKLVNPNISI